MSDKCSIATRGTRTEDMSESADQYQQYQQMAHTNVDSYNSLRSQLDSIARGYLRQRQNK